MNIAIIYHSGFGHTEKLAHSVEQGAKEIENADVFLVKLDENPTPWNALEEADALIFGSPTYNGSVSARFKQFMEESTRAAFIQQKWKDKLAAGFTNSGAMHGDKLNTLITMSLFAAQHGMLWVNLGLMAGSKDSDMNRVGGWIGAMAQSDDASPEITPIKSDLDTARYLGRRVAEMANKFSR